jgi:hypothetical protein
LADYARQGSIPPRQSVLGEQRTREFQRRVGMTEHRPHLCAVVGDQLGGERARSALSRRDPKRRPRLLHFQMLRVSVLGRWRSHRVGPLDQNGPPM